MHCVNHIVGGSKDKAQELMAHLSSNNTFGYSAPSDLPQILPSAALHPDCLADVRAKLVIAERVVAELDRSLVSIKPGASPRTPD